MEFRMTTDLSVINPSELAFNFEEIESYLVEKTERYRNLLVQEDDLAGAKKDRANLRKLATALDEQKKAVKKVFMKPYTEFEEKVKKLIALCDEPAKNIDEQIKAYEAAAKAAKRAELSVYFNEKIANASEYVSFDDVFDPKWLNATVALDAAKSQIDEICERFLSDVEALNGLCETTDAATATSLRRCYRMTKSISKVISTKTEIERELAYIEERKRAEAARKEQERMVSESETEPVPETLPFEPTPEEIQEEQEPEVIEIAFRVRCTKEQLASLKQFLVSNNISYGKA